MARVVPVIDESKLPFDLRNVLADANRNDNRAAELVADLNLVQLNWQPLARHTWSVGQCVSHVALTTHTYLDAMDEALERAPKAAFQSMQGGWLGNWFLGKTEPPPKIRINAPAKIVPPSYLEPVVLEDFWISNDALRLFAARCPDHDINSVRFRNPFFFGLRLFSVTAGLLIINAHARRHLWQADQVRRNPNFPR